MQSNVNYALEEIIGEGAMAIVYKARHRELDSFHAIKKLKIQDFDVQKRLIQEGRLLAGIRHPNILNVTDLVKLDGVPSLVMEYIQGPSLALMLSRFEINEKQSDALARGIMNGVMAAHKKGLIHRDLKPGNILIDVVDDMVVPKVADFGLAKILHSSQPILPQTRSGVTMGTPAYMAPEQIKHFGSVDERADIFSLGIILYELVTGKGCFTGVNTMEIWEHICNGKYVLPEEIKTSLPARMRRTIERALLVDRDQRFSSVQEMLDCWCTDENGEYVPLLSKDERGFWSKELLERILSDEQEEVVEEDETIDFSAQIDIAPLVNMVQELDNLHSKKATSPPVSIHNTIKDDAHVPSSITQSSIQSVLGAVVVAALALVFIFWNSTDKKQETGESQSTALIDESPSFISDSLLNPFEVSSKSYVIFEQARDRLLTGKYYDACFLLRELIHDGQQHAAVFALQGLGEFLRGNTHESVFLMKRAEHLAVQHEEPYKEIFQANRVDDKNLQRDPLIHLLVVVSKWSHQEQSPIDALVSHQQSYPKSIVFLHLELRHYRETGKWEQYDQKVQKLASVYTSSAALQMEYGLRQSVKNPKEVEERLLHLQKTDVGNVDIHLYLANFFALQGDEHSRTQQFMMSMSDTIPKKEQMRFISSHAKVLAGIGRVFESEKLWTFCLDGFEELELIPSKARCALDALESIQMSNVVDTQQKWMDSLSKSISSQYLPAEWRIFYSSMLRVVKGKIALLSNDQSGLQAIEKDLVEKGDEQIPFFPVSSILLELEQQKVLHTYNQAEQHQYIQEKYKQNLPTCSNIMIAASIAEKGDLPDQAYQWREDFLNNRCAFRFPKLLSHEAHIHVDLANVFAQQGNVEKAQEHLQTFFRLWNNADGHVPLYQKAQKIAETLSF